MRQPLRYRISDWSQLALCRSNNDADMRIEVTSFILNDDLGGTRISIVHPSFGNLFTYIVGSCGSLVASSRNGEYISELTPGEILNELERFGFLVEFSPKEMISGKQIQYLMTLQELGYDKIRILPVHRTHLGEEVFTSYVVAFNVSKHERWLEVKYSPSTKEFETSCIDGTAYNISNVPATKHFRWDWLEGWIGDIRDIIRDYTYTKEDSSCLH